MCPLGCRRHLCHSCHSHDVGIGHDIIAIEHDIMSILVFVAVEHGIDTGLVNLCCNGLAIGILIVVAWSVFVPTGEAKRLATERQTEMGGFQGVGQCLGHIKISKKQIAGRYAPAHHGP